MSRSRTVEGKYDLDGDFRRICECGHTLGVHAAANDTHQRPCFNEDKGAGGDGNVCECKNFRLICEQGGRG